MRQTPCVFALPSSCFAERRLHRRFEHGENLSGRIFEPGDHRAVPAHDPKPRGEALRGHLQPESSCIELFYLSKIEKLLRCLQVYSKRIR